MFRDKVTDTARVGRIDPRRLPDARHECVLHPGALLFPLIGGLHSFQGLDISVAVSPVSLVFDNDFKSFTGATGRCDRSDATRTESDGTVAVPHRWRFVFGRACCPTLAAAEALDRDDRVMGDWISCRGRGHVPPTTPIQNRSAPPGRP